MNPSEPSSSEPSSSRTIPAWLFGASDLLKNLDANEEGAPPQILQSLPTCEVDCADGELYYRVIAAWCVTWDQLVLRPLLYFFKAWLALPAEKRGALIAEVKAFADELGEHTWRSSMLRRDDHYMFVACYLCAMRTEKLAHELISSGATVCLKTYAVLNGWPGGQWTKFLANERTSSQSPYDDDMCSDAASHGHLAMLRVVREHGGVVLGVECCRAAALLGQLECLQYLLASGCGYLDRAREFAHRVNWIAIAAASGGHLACLHLLCRYDHAYVAHHGWPQRALELAAAGGRLDCLRYLVENSREQQQLHHMECVCNNAASNGRIECLRYLHSKNWYWDERTCTNAARNGQLECVAFLHEHGCPWNAIACSDAASAGKLDCLAFLHEHGCPWDAHTCTDAARNGHLDCLEYAHEHGCPWNKNVIAEAAGYGHLDCLRYAYERGCCQWYSFTIRVTAANGHLDCLRYAHEHGCPWSLNTCRDAAANGHLDCLRYAHEHGCPWDSECVTSAVRFHRDDCFHYLISQGCRMNQRDCMLQANTTEQLRLIMANSRLRRGVNTTTTTTTTTTLKNHRHHR